MKLTKPIYKILSALLAAILVLGSCFVGVSAEKDKVDGGSNLNTVISERLPYMSEVLDKSAKTSGRPSTELGFSDAKGTFEITEIEGKSAANVTRGGELTYSFNVENSGLYYFSLEYVVTGAANNNAGINLLVDGKITYFECENIKLYRRYHDVGEITVNSKGDEVRLQTEEIAGWQVKELRDSKGFYSSPLVFWFEAGNHSVTLECVSQSFAVTSLWISGYSEPVTYKQLSSTYGDAAQKNGIILLNEAEESVDSKNDATIRIEADGDPATTPIAYGYRVFNCVGGYRWRSGNQAITFGFDIKESGYYQIGFRYLQSWNDGIPSYRKIEIDGNVPCVELSECRFDYSSNWQTKVLGAEAPYLFWLEKGHHTIEMTTILGEATSVVQSLYDDMSLLSEMLLDITMLCGNDPDPNYDYRFYKFLPDLEGQFTELIESLQESYDNIYRLSGRNTSMGSNFKSIIGQLKSMRDDPFTIAKRYSQLTNAQENLGSWYLGCQISPLLIDRFSIATSDIQIKYKEANIFQKIKSTIKNFIISFSKDYNGVGSIVGNDTKITDEITVWIARGTEWVEAIQELTDSSFTKETGIRVNMRVVPASQLNTGSTNVLLLSIISGTAPSVALGVSSSSPVEFAMRDAIVKLSNLEGYDEVCNNFLENSLIAYKFQDGYYALPETINFNCLFYRTDIFKRYNINVPSTREELYYVTLPALYQNGMEFYQSKDYMQFLYQNGGKLYNDDGHTCALDSSVAVSSFKEYVEMFTNYACDVNANFFNRFRSGEMPIGMGGYGMYLQLCTAAPELMGKWRIAPVIGAEGADGVVNRTSVGLAGTCGIVLKNDNKKTVDNSWEFLKWWVSEKTQVEFSGAIESLIGVEGRWNSANINAFLSLDWDFDDLEVIKEQLEWMIDTPVLPGSYYTGTYINNAFTEVVVSEKMSARDALEIAVKSINRELKDKQKEYGLYEEP